MLTASSESSTTSSLQFPPVFFIASLFIAPINHPLPNLLPRPRLAPRHSLKPSPFRFEGTDLDKLDLFSPLSTPSHCLRATPHSSSFAIGPRPHLVLVPYTSPCRHPLTRRTFHLIFPYSNHLRLVRSFGQWLLLPDPNTNNLREAQNQDLWGKTSVSQTLGFRSNSSGQDNQDQCRPSTTLS